jgi:hypothetical protein
MCVADKGLDAKLKILKILHQNANESDGCGAPYYFQLFCKPGEKRVNINLKVYTCIY